MLVPAQLYSQALSTRNHAPWPSHKWTSSAVRLLALIIGQGDGMAYLSLGRSKLAGMKKMCLCTKKKEGF